MVRGFLLETMVSLGSISEIWGNCGKINLGSGFSPLNRYLVLVTSISKKIILKKEYCIISEFFIVVKTRFVWLTQTRGVIWHVIKSFPMVTFQKRSRGCGYMFSRFTMWHCSCGHFQRENISLWLVLLYFILSVSKQVNSLSFLQIHSDLNV